MNARTGRNMKSLAVLAIVVIVNALNVGAFYKNSFDVIRGCKQYNSIAGYDCPLTYFPTANFRHVGVTVDSKFFKLAVLGPNDGHIRFGDSLYPYDKDVIEIVLGGWANTKSVGRRQRRFETNKYTNIQLTEAQTPNVLSLFHPTVFVMEVFNNGTVQVSIDGQEHPFLSFTDKSLIPVDYMAFAKFDKDLVYFYDCPLENANRVSDNSLRNNITEQ